jgi:hypothetical protein
VKLAIQWHDDNDVLVVRSFEEAVAARQVLLGYATFVAPNADTERALQQAREVAAKKLRDDARDRRSSYESNWLRGQTRLETAQLVSHAMKAGWRE